MTRIPKFLLLTGASVLAMMLAVPLVAQEDLERPPPIPPEEAAKEAGDVPIPPKVEQEQIEPTVTIREEENRTIEEYRLNGRVYMVKVTPRRGVPYYYIDTDGDGQLELDVDQQAMNPVQPVHWKVLEWE